MDLNIEVVLVKVEGEILNLNCWDHNSVLDLSSERYLERDAGDWARSSGRSALRQD